MKVLETAPPKLPLIASRAGRFAALAAICLAELIVVLDNTIVNVALPTIAIDLNTGISGLQWVVDAYTLTFSGLLLAFGSLGDRFGRRKIMIIGLLGIAAMSVLGATAESLSAAITARTLMGICAAAVFPATLALITNIFTDVREKALAIGAWTAMAGFAVAIGPISGGWLLEHYSWHSVFWINVPLALLAIAAVLWKVPESKSLVSSPLDPIGIGLSIVGITALIWAIIEAPHHGWLSSTTLTIFAGSILTLTAFVIWELRTSSPLLNMRLFLIPRFALPALAIAIGYFSMFGFLFLITLYFQGIREYSPLGFGIASLPFAGAVAVGAPIATVLAQKIGSTAVICFGLLTLAVGLYLGGQVTVDSSYVGGVLPSMLCLAFGLGIIQGPATESVMSSVPQDEAGAGSAVNDTTREFGGTLGVAVFGSIMASIYGSKIGPIVEKIPSTVIDEQSKDYIRSSVLSILQIRKTEINPLFENSKIELIRSMKDAALRGSEAATYVGVGAILV
ncbi:MAG: MFS transporter, partial [Mycobacteriaceae bacterium]